MGDDETYEDPIELALDHLQYLMRTYIAQDHQGELRDDIAAARAELADLRARVAGSDAGAQQGAWGTSDSARPPPPLQPAEIERQEQDAALGRIVRQIAVNEIARFG